MHFVINEFSGIDFVLNKKKKKKFIFERQLKYKTFTFFELEQLVISLI